MGLNASDQTKYTALSWMPYKRTGYGDGITITKQTTKRLWSHDVAGHRDGARSADVQNSGKQTEHQVRLLLK